MNLFKQGRNWFVVDIRDALFDELYDIMKVDSRVMLLVADMGAWKMEQIVRDLPQQYMNVGIAEQNLIGVAAGLALVGRRVFVYGIAAFVSDRCYEQIKMDLCEMNLPVTIIGAGPGLSYGSDGPSHHAIHDIAVMSQFPNMF